MNYLEVIKQGDACALVWMLSEACGVRHPKLSFAGRKQRRGTYCPRKRTIMLHRQTQVWIVAHEFAHYLDHVETGRNIAAQSNDKEWHSQGFYYKLRKVTRLLGEGYPWGKEYRQIARWASRDKLFVRAHGGSGETMMAELLTEDWLKDAGFKWHQLDRQPSKQWLLWIGDAAGAGDAQDLGIEVTQGANDGLWFCWLRSDCAHRYSRFLHIRHIATVGDLVAMIEGLTGQKFSRDNNLYGVMQTAEKAARLRADRDRLDQRWLREGHPWRDIEKDDSRGGALPEHMQDSITKGTSK